MAGAHAAFWTVILFILKYFYENSVNADLIDFSLKFSVFHMVAWFLWEDTGSTVEGNVGHVCGPTLNTMPILQFIKLNGTWR